MFIKNKYTKYYNNIIENAKSRVTDGYAERHHIVPKSLGGDDDLDNLVALTAREHFVCHLLLPKMLTGANREKMIYAVSIMSGRKVYNSRIYESYRKEAAALNTKYRSGKGNGMYGVDRKGEKNTFYGKHHTDETKRRLSEINKGHSHNKGIPKSEDHKKKISASRRKQGKQFTFEHNNHGKHILRIAELHESFPEQKLRKDELWKLTAGKYKTYKGWSC